MQNRNTKPISLNRLDSPNNMHTIDIILLIILPTNTVSNYAFTFSGISEADSCTTGCPIPQEGSLSDDKLSCCQGFEANPHMEGCPEFLPD